MMNEKQVEALKLALKALKEINSCGYATCWHGAFDTEVVVLMDVLQETNSLGLKGVYTGTHKDCEIKHTIDHYPQPAPKDKQQEPVAEVNVRQSPHGGCGIASVLSHKLPVGSWLLYTFPPASKPWVGLEESEWREIDDRHDWTTTQGRIDAAEEIEAKLRELNEQGEKNA